MRQEVEPTRHKRGHRPRSSTSWSTTSTGICPAYGRAELYLWLQTKCWSGQLEGIWGQKAMVTVAYHTVGTACSIPLPNSAVTAEPVAYCDVATTRHARCCTDTAPSSQMRQQEIGFEGLTGMYLAIYQGCPCPAKHSSIQRS